MSPNDPGSPMNDLPKMVPDREDIVKRRKNVLEEKVPSATDSRTPIWLVIIVFAIAGSSAFLYWQNFQLSIKLDNASQELSLSNARISALEGQLSATGENLVVNESNIKAQFSNHMSEIRKLWDVTNKRNKVWIQDNQAAVKQLKNDTSVLQKEVSRVDTEVQKKLGTVTQDMVAFGVVTESATSDIKDLTIQTGSMAAVINAAESDLTKLQSRLVTVGSKVDELSLAQSLLSDQVRSQDLSGVEGRIQTETQKIDALTQKVNVDQNEVSQDIESINTHRLQINQRLSSLQEQLTVLENKLQAMSP